jgi:hydroxypyruvate isomerase
MTHRSCPAHTELRTEVAHAQTTAIRAEVQAVNALAGLREAIFEMHEARGFFVDEVTRVMTTLGEISQRLDAISIRIAGNGGCTE